jgi:hypothetical protein
LKTDQLTKAPESLRVAIDHRDERIESPSEAIDPPSLSRSVVSTWAEQIKPLLLDPAIIAEPAGSLPEAVARTVETSASSPDPINDISQIRLPFYTASVSSSYRPGASVAADGWTQADLSRFTGMQGKWADVTPAEASLRDPAREAGLEPVPAADRRQRGLANVTLLLAGLQNENQGLGQDEGQRRALASPGALFPWADGSTNGLFGATASPSIPRPGPFEMGREVDTVADVLRGTTSPVPETRTGSADQPWPSQSGQDAAESESLGNLTSRLAAVAERLEQAALRLASQTPPLAAAPRPFQGRVDA